MFFKELKVFTSQIQEKECGMKLGHWPGRGVTAWVMGGTGPCGEEMS